MSEIIIAIPGNWPSQSEIAESIATHSGGYRFTENVLTHSQIQWKCRLEVHEHNPELRHAFAYTGRGTFSETELTAIDEHACTLYLRCQAGSTENARAMMHAATALLHCGGIAIKIESAGVAHTAGYWCELANNESSEAVLSAYVTLVGGEGMFYSCGMHNLGRRDVFVNADISREEAGEVLQAFLRRLLGEAPAFSAAGTFRVSEDSPGYRATESLCLTYPENSPLCNPHGMWSLEPM
jgi:hypothetical protein